MKKQALGLLLLLTGSVHGQTPGEWTWMKGPNGAINSTGSHGVMGIPAAVNNPPARFEPLHWTDLDGNFWLYGGHSFSGAYGDLWKYDPTSNQWTWEHGSSSIAPPAVYGTLGVPAPSNTPGVRRYLGPCWTYGDDLWFFGGYIAPPNNNHMSDLWKYNIASGMWTWMNGPQTGNQAGSYGVQGVPSPTNLPASKHKCSAAWTDSNGGLWMFGGRNGNLLDDQDDLWRYDIATNTWTWMKGSSTSGAAPVYGTLGVEAPGNTPGARQSFLSWQDPAGHFWLFSGSGDRRSDLWRYNPGTNNWAWMGGTPTAFDPGSYGTQCTADPTNLPAGRVFGSPHWTDASGNFWMFGGSVTGSDLLNDLWMFDVYTHEWTWVSGSSGYNAPDSYGTLGMSSSTNMPGARVGATGFRDQQGNFWVFGGYDASNGAYNDMWRYLPDAACVGTSTGEMEDAAEPMSIYPCPADNELVIDLPRNSDAQVIRIVDALGRELYRQPTAGVSDRIRIPTGAYTSGIYWVTLEGNDHRQSRMITVQH